MLCLCDELELTNENKRTKRKQIYFWRFDFDVAEEIRSVNSLLNVRCVPELKLVDDFRSTRTVSSQTCVQLLAPNAARTRISARVKKTKTNKTKMSRKDDEGKCEQSINHRICSIESIWVGAA